MTEIVARQYTNVPKPIEAMQVEPGSVTFIAAWCGGEIRRYGAKPYLHAAIVVRHSGGSTVAYTGDYILKQDEGFSVREKEDFESEYYQVQNPERRKRRRVFPKRKTVIEL